MVVWRGESKTHWSEEVRPLENILTTGSLKVKFSSKSNTIQHQVINVLYPNAIGRAGLYDNDAVTP